MIPHPKPVVGQTLYATEGSTRGGDAIRLVPVEVMKVGRLYFYTAKEFFRQAEHCWQLHVIKRWMEEGEHLNLYVSPEDYENKQRRQRQQTEIERAFNYGGVGRRLSNKDIAAIHTILFPTTPE